MHAAICIGGCYQKCGELAAALELLTLLAKQSSTLDSLGQRTALAWQG